MKKSWKKQVKMYEKKRKLIENHKKKWKNVCRLTQKYEKNFSITIENWGKI